MTTEKIIFTDHDVLPADVALNAFFQIETACERKDPDFAMLYDDFIANALKYSQFRSKWATYSNEQKAEFDRSRTSAHNVFIQDCDIIARRMKHIGMDTSWRAEVGDDRKRIGDFACWITAIVAIRAR